MVADGTVISAPLPIDEPNGTAWFLGLVGYGHSSRCCCVLLMPFCLSVTRRLEFSKAPGNDAMARRDDVDDYVVFDPLLEAAKGKFSRAAQREKKKQTNWAGKGQG